MNIRNVSAIMLCFVLACVALLPAARAGEYNETTKLVFSAPVEIPGRVLPAGTYWFVLQNNNTDRNVVQIFNADRSELEATLLTLPTDRERWTPETEVKLAERPQQKPEALLKWYYPGRLEGHEFQYSAKHEREFARDAKQDVLAEPMNLASNAVTTRP